MAFLAKMPLAQASGMGLNSLVGGLVAMWAAGTYGVQFTLGQAFMMVLISGLIFLALTLVKINGKNVLALFLRHDLIDGYLLVYIEIFIFEIEHRNDKISRQCKKDGRDKEYEI